MSLAFAFEDTDKFAAISQQRALASTQAPGLGWWVSPFELRFLSSRAT